MVSKEQSLKELRTIPGVGKVVANDLWNLGIKSISDLINKKPENLYHKHNLLKGKVQDRCMLYTFRCAVYFANTEKDFQEPEKLKWWNWMDDDKKTHHKKAGNQ
ncbi:MAG TPA: helix-hairpin-helix domain-containing protein [Leptospiraceae bacterium]|nr:helix-hairpin-helix domain-containing protein [Leptospiraceae bacterium]HMW04054.1 helix-hairpin-helix domain-containing protein [Leptospiraceae bacterium]HMX30944.1 helix-hairpin-helix domain-containing protein [Leptospiraceae bacterium]HMY30048.1 helix-hairpin-helix domain-containing protein [Leptospiraceae bacterium]HMZ62765.1 helix-hairpin-helix domain-containing protein [Leptospiraceae bacterium]